MKIKKPKYAVKLVAGGKWSWSKKEDSILRKFAGNVPTKLIGKKLGRTAIAVKDRAVILGLSQAYINSKPNDFTDILGKKIEFITPYKVEPKKGKHGQTFLWCKDERLPNGPDKLIQGCHFRNGKNKGIQGLRGVGWLNKKTGYVILQKEGKHFLAHRVIIAEALGRPLRKDESVHHGLKGRSVNTLDNLEVRRRANHPIGHGEIETAEWLKSLGWEVRPPKRLEKQA